MNPLPHLLTTAPLPTEQARIVEAAQVLYFQRGIAEVSLAEVAHYLRLPESTVLHWFADKATLVEAVVEAHARAVYDEMGRHKANSSTAVEELLALRNWASAEMQRNLAPFFQQLAADYPAGRQRWQAHMASFPLEHLRDNLHWGIAQALYRDGLDVDFLVRLWFHQMSTLDNAAAVGLEGADMHRTLLEHFLAGIVTPARALVARRLQEAYPFY